MKRIITHINPDSDAVVAAWLIRKFLPGWQTAEIGFAEANETTVKRAQAADPHVLFVDVGRGQLDHHQTGELTCATKLAWEYIKKSRFNQPLRALELKAVEALVKVETEIDNTRDLHWPEISEPRAAFYFQAIIESLRGLAETDEQVMTVGLRLTEAIFGNLKNKVKAREELKTGVKFTTPWGKGVAITTGNKYVGWEGEVAGFAVVVQKDPQKGGVRIYARWDTDADLTRVYNKVKAIDGKANWFLHASKKLLLNWASVNKSMRPTKLSLEKLIEIVKGE